MSLSIHINRSPPPHLLRHPYHRNRSASFLPAPSASLYNGADIFTKSNPPTLQINVQQSLEGTKDRIRKLFNKVDLSVSSYDTAWVAMLPSPTHSHTPCFPQCLRWLVHNQLPDGSWGPLPHFHPTRHPLLLKDALSSTLASILALKRWDVCELQVNQGLKFIETNFASATDNNQHSPIGFDIIFPGMLEYAKSLDLRLPIEPTLLNAMLRKRDSELRRCHSEERESYLAYVSEGLGHVQDWNMVMKYQMKNGSILNSPSTTAATLAHHHDAGCLDYLFSLLDQFGDAVPTVDPLDLYLRLCMVDNLTRLGIDRHFRVEIESTLDETYRCWQQDDEQLFMDIATSALAFRLLRMNGYDVSSDRLSEVAQKEDCFNSRGGHSKDVSAVLEVYRASELIIHEDESALQELNSRSTHFLQQKLLDTSFSNSDGLTKRIIQEVDDALKFPFTASLERMATRRYIENYILDSSRILKTCYWSSNTNNRDFLKLAVEDYKACQSTFQREMEYMERWVVENKLNELKFARQKTVYGYFTAAGTLFSPEQSDARLSWAKGCILVTMVDDLFDAGGSMEELVNLVQLIEKWDVNVDKSCCSENVRILFLAIKQTVRETEEAALKWQGRSVKRHLAELWLDMVNCMMKEAVWAKDGSVPELEEYLRICSISFALGPIILPALYLVGPKLSEEMVRSAEYDSLFNSVNCSGRLLNDTRSFKRELEQGKLNTLALRIIHGNGKVTEEEAARETMISSIRHGRELLRLVLTEKGSVVPRACKDLFWNMCLIMNFFYSEGDGYSLDYLLNTAKSIIHEPVSVIVTDESLDYLLNTAKSIIHEPVSVIVTDESA